MYFFLKMEMVMGGGVVIITCLAVVLSKITEFGYDGSTEASTNLAMGLTWVIALTDWVAFTLYSMNIVSQGMSSAERIFEYASPAPHEIEKPAVREGDQELEDKNWP
jgi:ABC-type multidrug transport system fused ATPase/permease subunit